MRVNKALAYQVQAGPSSFPCIKGAKLLLTELKSSHNLSSYRKTGEAHSLRASSDDSVV